MRPGEGLLILEPTCINVLSLPYFIQWTLTERRQLLHSIVSELGKGMMITMVESEAFL